MRTIDADALLEAITEFPYGYRGMIKSVIAEQPTIEPEPSQVARDIATILENEQDMRVIERNAENEMVVAHFNVKENAELIARIMDCDVNGEIYQERKKGKWIPVTRIEKWHKEDGLVGFPPEVKEFPQCTIEWVDATEPDEVDGLRCSECGTVYDFTEARNWCSECGAEMGSE